MAKPSLWQRWEHLRETGNEMTPEATAELAKGLRGLEPDEVLQLERMKLTDFRCFSQLSVVFDRNLTVFHGGNGRGKSSLLDAAAKAMSWVEAGIVGANSRGLSISEDDIRLSDTEETSGNRAEADVVFSLDQTAIRGQLLKNRRGTESSAVSDLRNLQSVGAMFRTLRAMESVSRPLLLYFAANRGGDYRAKVSQNELRSVGKRLDAVYRGTEAYDRAVQADKSPAQFLGWLTFYGKRARFHPETAEREAAIHRLSQVKDAIRSFWPECTDVRWDAASGWDQIIVERNGVPLAHHQLSDGERMVFFLFGEIAWRLTELNPQGNAAEGSGIVLIDEIELHLHPQWQLTVIESLRRTFPHLQFIITTHSPLVLTTVRRECVRNLPEHIRAVEDLQSPADQTRSLSSNDILELVMNTASAPTQFEETRWLAECQTAILERRLPQAQSLFKKVSDYFGPENPQVMVLKAMLKAAERATGGQS